MDQTQGKFEQFAFVKPLWGIRPLAHRVNALKTYISNQRGTSRRWRFKNRFQKYGLELDERYAWD